jgi:hypothetical protein
MENDIELREDRMYTDYDNGTEGLPDHIINEYNLWHVQSDDSCAKRSRSIADIISSNHSQ